MEAHLMNYKIRLNPIFYDELFFVVVFSLKVPFFYTIITILKNTYRQLGAESPQNYFSVVRDIG